MTTIRQRNSEGATAIMVAVLATVLLTTAALSVDLGNAWARKRDVQTQVDVAAISAGRSLPRTASNVNTILADVRDYLNTANNLVPGQAPVTIAGLKTPDTSDGYVQFVDDLTMRVVAPSAWVDFGLGGFISDGVNVTATATVQLRSKLPPAGKVLPFAVPDQCPFGPGMADTRAPGKTKTDTSGTFDFGSARSGEVTSLSISPNPLPGGYEQTATATVVLEELPNNTTVGEIRVLFQSGGAGFYVEPTAWSPTGPTGNRDDTRTVTVTIPTEVKDGPGQWNVYGEIGRKYTESYASFTVGDFVNTSTEIGCSTSASGQFGQLYSPRGGAAPDQRALGLNIAEGIDHAIYPYKNATTPDCAKKNQTPPSPGVQDNAGAVRPNCVLPQTGNDGPWMLKGLITGLEGVKGRLDATRTNGATTCGPNAARTTNVTREGVSINNDVLSCFLRAGYRLDDLTRTDLTEEAASKMLDPSVTKSPRLIWVPVLYASTRAEIDNNTFFKVKRFVPGFITDETRNATQPASDATANNGIIIAGQLESIQIFMINPLTLPKDERALTVDYDPLLQREVTLID